jgi:tyrosinase
VIGPTDQMPASAVGQPVIDNILATADFETFGSVFVPSSCTVGCQRRRSGTGALEGTPHNIVHGTIGGNMGTFMSPLDPIFWLHHCNVDRLWMEWNKSFANPANDYWQNFDFADNFVDGQGNPVTSVIVKALFDTFALGYRYDTQPEADLEAVAPEPKSASVVASHEVETSGAAPEMGAALTIPLELPAEVRERLEPGIEAGGAETTVRLSLTGIDTPSDPVVVHLFLGGEAASASPESANFVRSFGFFPAVAADDPHSEDKVFLFDVGAKLAAAAGGGAVPIHVRTEPLRPGIEAAGAGVRPESVKIEVIERAA